MIKTPLRYPGGKSRAVKKLLPLIPSFSEYREPFLGGGSVFIALKQKYPEKQFWINDFYQDLYHFWLNMKDNNHQLVEGVQKVKNTESDGKLLFRKLQKNNPNESLQKAVRFFVLNRIIFSGTIESGGYSQGAFEGRFTQSSIDKLQKFKSTLADTKITGHDYESIVNKAGSNVFMFLDPPYLSVSKPRLYGKKGALHTSFDHTRFAKVMSESKHQWMITYDDCPETRELFSFANILDWELQYGMNNYKQKNAAKGKELIITNYTN